MGNPSDLEQVQANELAARVAKLFKESTSVVLAVVMLLWMLALIGFDARDPGWSHLSYQAGVSNIIGPLGAWWADLTFSMIGFAGYLMPIAIWLPLYRYIKRDRTGRAVYLLPYVMMRIVGIFLLISSVAAWSAINISNVSYSLPFSTGGLWGEAIGDSLVGLLGLVGTNILCAVAGLIGVSVYSGISLLRFVEMIGAGVFTLGAAVLALPSLFSRKSDASAEPGEYSSKSARAPRDMSARGAAAVSQAKDMPIASHVSTLGRQATPPERKVTDYSQSNRRYTVSPSESPVADADSETVIRHSVDGSSGANDAIKHEPTSVWGAFDEQDRDESDILFSSPREPQIETRIEPTFDGMFENAEQSDPLLTPAVSTDLKSTSVAEAHVAPQEPQAPRQEAELERRMASPRPQVESDKTELDSELDSLRVDESLDADAIDALLNREVSAQDAPPWEDDEPSNSQSVQSHQTAPVTEDVPHTMSQPVDLTVALTEAALVPVESIPSTPATQVVEEETPKSRLIVPLSESHTPMKAQDMGLDEVKSNKPPELVTPVRKLPNLDLLDPPPEETQLGYSEEQLGDMSSLLEIKLKDFNVVAEVVAVNPGPVITRFELQPAPGVKASKITNLASDLARSMAVSRVRVVEVIPGKSVIGIEIPNEHRQTVQLSEVLTSKVYQEAESHLTLALGNDIGGNPVVANLARMPHLLVAGTTGSGKSVGVNAMLLSLLFKATPDEVRLMLVDPKMLELSIYDGIPHLLTPVITDMKDAASGLRWCVAEMERRYRLMAKLGVRNLAGYNEKIKKAKAKGEPILDPLWNPEEQGHPPTEPAPPLESLPYIVVVIDEFADMMMLVGKKVEELIARIAQKARAAGIHLILATQRPSVDVITGLIKANVPTRIAFQVSSKIDSRTILDQAGAENLLGWGDMLYLPPGTSLTNRVHGAFVSDDEVHRTVEAWKQLGQPEFIEDIFSQGIDGDSGGLGNGGDSEQDPLYDQAVAIVTETRKASISSIQRRLSVGYNRAARMIEAMEASGVVSEQDSNNRREVLAPPPVRD